MLKNEILLFGSMPGSGAYIDQESSSQSVILHCLTKGRKKYMEKI